MLLALNVGFIYLIVLLSIQIRGKVFFLSSLISLYVLVYIKYSLSVINYTNIFRMVVELANNIIWGIHC
jgi:hypothetical protein